MTNFVSAHLDDRHNLAYFSCGNSALDDWLRLSAMRAHRAGISRVTVWSPVDDTTKVAAFYTLSPAQVAAADGLPRKAAGGFSAVPSWLLGRLAVDAKFQGAGVGREVLLDALDAIVSVAAIGGGRIIVVDPINESAATWSQKFGFIPFGRSTAGRPPRYYISIDRVVESLRQAAESSRA